MNTFTTIRRNGDQPFSISPTFCAAVHAGMQQGWGGTFEQLTAYLAGK